MGIFGSEKETSWNCFHYVLLKCTSVGKSRTNNRKTFNNKNYFLCKLPIDSSNVLFNVILFDRIYQKQCQCRWIIHQKLIKRDKLLRNLS